VCSDMLPCVVACGRVLLCVAACYSACAVVL